VIARGGITVGLRHDLLDAEDLPPQLLAAVIPHSLSRHRRAEPQPPHLARLAA
jgi:hypothetical protein